MDREKLFRYLDERYSSKRDMISRIPLGVQPDTLWQELLNRRRSHSTVLPLYDQSGKPYWYVTTDKMVAASEKIVDALFENETEFDPYAQAPPVSTLEEVFYTSYVEGAQITMQAAMDFLTSDQPPRDIEEQMISNNRMAGTYASDNLYRPIDMDLLRDLVYILTEGMDNGGGDFRPYEGTDYVSQNGEDIRFPPPGSIPDMIHSLCVFLGDTKTHPLIKAAIAQAYILVVRPFTEGNERLSRILSGMILMRSGYTFFSDVSLSALIARRSYAYYEAVVNILSEENGGDLTYFTDYYLELLSRAVDERKLRLRQEEDRVRKAETEMARTVLSASSDTGSSDSFRVSAEAETAESPPDTDGVEDDIPDGFVTVSSDEDLSLEEIEERDYQLSLARVQDKLYEIMDGKSMILKRCAGVMLGIIDNGVKYFTIEDIRKGCNVTMKQAGNLVTHLRQKGLIESCDSRKRRGYMDYRFGTGFPLLTTDDYSHEILSAIERLRSAYSSEKDRQIGELIYSCLPMGIIRKTDYHNDNADGRPWNDMALPVQMGLVVRLDRGVYRINKEFNINNLRLTEKNKETLTNLYTAFKEEWFTRKEAMTVMEQARSGVYNILHQFTAQGLLEIRKGKDNRYRLLVDPSRNPVFFFDSCDFTEYTAISNEQLQFDKRDEDALVSPDPESYNNREYAPQVYELINTLAASENSTKDRRLGKVMQRCIQKGTLLRSDYDTWGYTENMWIYDTDLAVHLGLIQKESRDVYSLNTELQPIIRKTHKKTITAIYENFGYDQFSSEMFIATLNYSPSYTYASLHNLTLMRILNLSNEKEGYRYRLMVNPEDHPECFEPAA